MLSLDPADRPTCEKVLVDYRNTIFPDYFYTFLQDYANDLQSKQESGSTSAGTHDPTVRFANKADEIVEAIADDWSGIIKAVIQEHQFSVGNAEGDEAGDGKVVDYSQYWSCQHEWYLTIESFSRTEHTASEHPHRQHAQLSTRFFSYQVTGAASSDGGSDTRRGGHRSNYTLRCFSAEG
jgi:hypothetical protein